jgi:small subunit ribosomal protein S2
MSKVTIEQLFSVGAHFGHKSKYRNPLMAEYIYSKKNELQIINLNKTLSKLEEALNFISKTAVTSNKILFVGTKRAAKNIVKSESERANMPYVNHRWLGGMLTNYKTVKDSTRRLKDLAVQKEKGLFEGMIKKEALKYERDLLKLEMSLGGIKNMRGLPEAVVVMDVGYEKIAVREANKLKIPVIGIVDSNNSPEGIDYVIPANDDSIKTIELIMGAFADTILESKLSKTTSEKNSEEQYIESKKEDLKESTNG